MNTNVIYTDTKVIVSETTMTDKGPKEWIAFVIRCTRNKSGHNYADEGHEVASDPSAECEIGVSNERLRELLTDRELVGDKAKRLAKNLGMPPSPR